MTTLNTIIEEEKKEFDRVFFEAPQDEDLRKLSDSQRRIIGNLIERDGRIKDFLTTAMQRAYEAGKADSAKENTPDTEKKCMACKPLNEWKTPSEKHTCIPDTEWEEVKDEIYTLLHEFHRECLKEPFDGEPLNRRARKNRYTDTIFNIFTVLLTSRDTYWKEMVRKEVEGIRKPETTFLKEGDETWDYSHIIAHNLALDTLLDNLK